MSLNGCCHDNLASHRQDQENSLIFSPYLLDSLFILLDYGVIHRIFFSSPSFRFSFLEFMHHGLTYCLFCVRSRVLCEYIYIHSVIHNVSRLSSETGLGQYALLYVNDF